MNNVEWTPEWLAETIKLLCTHGSDTQFIEVKKAHGGYPGSLDATLSSFSNSSTGGIIICGLDENNDFAPVGVYDPADLEKTLGNKLRRGLKPPNTMESGTILYEDAKIFVAAIPPLPPYERPAYIGGKAYVRSGDGDHEMSRHETDLMVAQRTRTGFDEEPVEYTSLADLDEGLKTAYLRDVRAKSRRLAGSSDEEVLRRKGIIALGTDNLSLAGLYALGSYPQEFRPSLKVTGVVIDPSGKARNLDKFEADGPIPAMLEETLAWVKRNLAHPVVELSNGHLINGQEVPDIALREILSNALVHRSLNPKADTEEVRVRIFPDRISVENPGGLYGITLQRLQEYGERSRVNDRLYDVCTHVTTPEDGYRVIEGEGSGIYTAQEAVRQAGLKPIQFVDGVIRFTAIISRVPLQETSHHVATDSGGSGLETLETEPPSMSPEFFKSLVGISKMAYSIDKAEEALAISTGNRRAAVLLALRSLRHPAGIDDIMGALPGPFAELQKPQIRYVLTKLLQEGVIVREGGRGNRNTVYRLA